MASPTYLRKKAKQRQERASKGGNARFEKYKKLHNPVVVGGCTTWGSLGKHTIELLDCGDEQMVWIRIDGELHTPRTMRGFLSVMSHWFYKKGLKYERT